MHATAAKIHQRYSTSDDGCHVAGPGLDQMLTDALGEEDSPSVGSVLDGFGGGRSGLTVNGVQRWLKGSDWRRALEGLGFKVKEVPVEGGGEGETKRKLVSANMRNVVVTLHTSAQVKLACVEASQHYHELAVETPIKDFGEVSRARVEVGLGPG